MSYWQYWDLNAAPFANSRHNFFRGQSIDEALARIEFVCNQRHSLVTLMGPGGIGKTTLLTALLHRPPRQAEQPAPQICLVSLLGFESGDLAIELARQNCGRQCQNSQEAWKLLGDCFHARWRSNTHTLLLIDDVENCGAEAELDLIRLVRSIEDKHISIVLSIENTLASTVSRWLLDRSYLHIELPAWDLQQTREFLRFMVARSGGTTTLFTDAAVIRLHEYSKGIVRRLVQLADLALIAGAVQQCKRIDESVIAQVVQELPRSASKAA